MLLRKLQQAQKKKNTVLWLGQWQKELNEIVAKDNLVI
jgi:hypothetical protein